MREFSVLFVLTFFLVTHDEDQNPITFVFCFLAPIFSMKRHDTSFKNMKYKNKIFFWIEKTSRVNKTILNFKSDEFLFATYIKIYFMKSKKRFQRAIIDAIKVVSQSASLNDFIIAESSNMSEWKRKEIKISW